MRTLYAILNSIFNSAAKFRIPQDHLKCQLERVFAFQLKISTSPRPAEFTQNSAARAPFLYTY